MNQTGADAAQAYLARLSRALRFLPAEDRAAIVAEIESHIADRTTEGGNSIFDTLEHLGEPEALAQSYIEHYRLEGALAHSAYGTVLVTMLERASRSILALVIGLGACLTYGLALVFTAVALIKPLWPAHVGLWTTERTFSLGIVDNPPPGMRELLGYWIIPFGAIAAILSYLGARKMLRFGGKIVLRKGVRKA
jgi:hypothetical protein